MKQREQSAERSAFWQKHHERQQASGVAVNAYCKQQGIGKQSFYQWRRRLQQQAPLPTTVRFAEIKSAASERTPTVLRVRLASGHEVEASAEADTATIEQILLTLLRTEKASK